MKSAPMLLDLVPQQGAARRLAVLTLIQSAANGLFLTSSVVFFVRVVGLRAGEVGLGLSLAGLAGFLATVPVGRLADRFGAQRLLAFDHAALTLLFALYPFVRGFTSFVLIASLISICEISGSPLRAALMHSVFAPEEAVRTRAQLRSAFNVGFMVGAGVAGLAVATASFTVFCAVSAGMVLAQALCVSIVLRLKVPDRDSREGPTPARARSALRDVRFLLVTFGNGLLELHTTVLIVGTPLWIVTHTAAPASLTSALVITNTVIVLLLQVRLSRGADTPAGAARLLRRAGLLLAAGCVICALSQGVGSVQGALALIAGTVILSVGEIIQSAGAWGLSFELPPPGRQAEYQGVFALGRGVQQFVGPALVTTLIVGVGGAGWLVLAALFAGVGLLCVPLVTGSWRGMPARPPASG